MGMTRTTTQATSKSHADASAALPRGYKRTEVGVIPEDWNIKPLAAICKPQGIVRGPFGGTLKKEVFVTSGFKVYEQRNAIHKSCEIGSYYIDRAKYEEMQRFSISPGDFIISCSGTIGRIYQIPRNAPPGIINQALLKLMTDEDLIHSHYFYLLFEWGVFQARIIESTQGGAMKNLVGMDAFKTTPITLPPAPEQHAIAEALSDMDSLIEALEKLIAKKRAIKQATMQQLLIGKTRLPGFSGEWETKAVGEIGELRNGYGFKSATYSDSGSYRIVTIANVQDGQMDLAECSAIVDLPRDLQSHHRLKIGDLLISMTGNVGRVCRVTRLNCLLNQRVGLTNLNHLARYMRCRPAVNLERKPSNRSLAAALYLCWLLVLLLQQSR